MTADVDARCLETFPQWLRTLGMDGETLVEALLAEGTPDAARRALTAGLNYVFKSVDLIPDGIDDIGYLDDAFVIRVAAAQALAEGLSATKHTDVASLASEARLVLEFLGDNYKRLDGYVTGLRRGAARGRSVDEILSNVGTRSEFVADVHGFARSYVTPSFGREDKNLIKLRAFLDAKLPR